MTGMATNKVLMRAKDIVLLVGAIGGLLIGLGKILVLASAVEMNANKIQSIEPVVASHTVQLAVEEDRWSRIQEQLIMINKKLDREGR